MKEKVYRDTGNKDLDKFAREIQSLCDRYDREE